MQSYIRVDQNLRISRHEGKNRWSVVPWACQQNFIHKSNVKLLGFSIGAGAILTISLLNPSLDSSSFTSIFLTEISLAGLTGQQIIDLSFNHVKSVKFDPP